MVCECQWGLSSLFFGLFIILAAGVFTFFPAFLDMFDYPWYIELCWLWFFIGCFFTAVGIIYECADCQPGGRWHNAKACEGEVEDGAAPAPYVMIDA
mmetsp:Transcript_99259/g.286410  ORF Transcript_99259/g.286410 Transcript_99259/m.286410 type:complete len:97 (+) Transcript_99259:51-341(+)